MQRTTSSISLEIALQQGTEQVFVRRDNISLGDMPTTSKLGPMSPLQTSCLNVYWAEQRQQNRQEVREGMAQRRKLREGSREECLDGSRERKGPGRSWTSITLFV